MTCGNAIYWTRKLMMEVQIELANQDTLSSDEHSLLRDLREADTHLREIEDLVDWLETNNYIREEI